MSKSSGGTRAKAPGNTKSIDSNVQRYVNSINDASLWDLPKEEIQELGNAVNKALGIPDIEKLMEMEDEMFNSLTNEQQLALSLYTGNDYSQISYDLNHGKSRRDITDALDSIMKPLTKPLVVFRTSYGEHNKSINKSYTSVTMSPERFGASKNDIEDGARTEAFRLPKGTKVIKVYGKEAEVIIERGFDLKRYKIN